MSKKIIVGITALILLLLSIFLVMNHNAQVVYYTPANEIIFESKPLLVDKELDLVTWQTQFTLGDQLLDVTPIQYLCERTQPKRDYTMPGPKAECWQVSVTWEDQTWDLAYGDVIQIDDYIYLKFSGNANVEDGEIDIDDVEDFLIRYHMYFDTDGFKATITEKDVDVKHQSDVFVPINFENNIVNDLVAGIQVKYTNKLFFIGDEIVVNEYPIDEGDNQILFSVPSDKLGPLDIEIFPYLKVKSTTIFDDEKDSTTYNVKLDVNNPDTFMCSVNSQCGVNEMCVDGTCTENYIRIPEVDLSIYIILSGIIVVLIAMIIYVKTPRGKQNG